MIYVSIKTNSNSQSNAFSEIFNIYRCRLSCEIKTAKIVLGNREAIKGNFVARWGKVSPGNFRTNKKFSIRQ